MHRRIGLLLAITVASGLAGADRAAACSCVPVDAQSLRKSDAAVIAKLKRIEPIGQAEGSPAPGAGQARFVYRVRRSLKGRRLDRGEHFSVRASTSGASCGLPTGVGRRYGLLLGRESGRWTASLCSVLEPEALRDLASDRGNRARPACRG